MDLVIKMAEKARYEEIRKIITTKEDVTYDIKKADGLCPYLSLTNVAE